MPTSVPRLEPALSCPTIDCFTGAIVAKEGPGAVGSTYLRDSSSSAVAPGLPTDTELGQLPPYRTGGPATSAPVFVVRAGPSAHAAARRPAHPSVPPQALPAPMQAPLPRPPRWPAALPRAWFETTLFVGAFAVGAAVASLSCVVSPRAGLVFAALTALVAGVVTLLVALARSLPDRR